MPLLSKLPTITYTDLTEEGPKEVTITMERLTIALAFDVIRAMRELDLVRLIRNAQTLLAPSVESLGIDEEEFAELSAEEQQKKLKEIVDNMTDAEKEVYAANEQVRKEQSLSLIIFDVLTALPEGQDEIYKVIASVLGKSKEEVQALPIDVFVQIIVKLKDHPDIKVFTRMIKSRIGVEEGAEEQTKEK